MSWGFRLAVLALFTCTWFVINGYSFGIVDHAIHLGFLLRELDPSLLKGDPLIEAAANHPSFFWTLQVPLVRHVPVEVLYAVVHIASVALMLAGTSALARALYPGRYSEWVATVAMLSVLIPRSYAGIPMLDELVLNRTVSLGPLLFALVLGVKRRYGAAFVLTGLVFLIHPTTAIHAAILLWFAALFDREKRLAIVTGPLLCMLAASPLLVPMLRQGAAAGVPFPPPDEWVLLTRVLVSWHHYPRDWTAVVWLQLLVPLVVLGLSLRAHRSRPVEAYLCGVAFTCVLGVLGTEVLHLPTALHLHLLEVLRFVPYLAAVCGAAWLLETWPAPGERKLPGVAAALLYLGFSTVQLEVSFPAMLAVFLLRPAARTPPRPMGLRWPVALGVIAAPLILAIRIYYFKVPPNFLPRLDMYKGWRMMAWSEQHLPKDALVVLPPFFHEWDLAFRFGAKRATFTTYKDGAEGSFSLAFMLDWKQRMEALCGCQPFDVLATRDNGGKTWEERVNAMRAVLKQGYQNSDAARLRGLGSRYGATHAVFEATDPAHPEFTLLYSDDEYRLYQLTP
ncbi:hypothetical protein D7Y13_00875 [Corallococcus praedator]|uniref:DUF6798 domain-containing protein n=1 Tax=Corallococcus praedator TaxID=2316724 RepID=A0ABX9QS44_9BACT|nr:MULTISPECIES: DUF6798 domain-containing protein [Corallococcus]RKH33027.1 hypothetical protein D7X75_13560 [Corallococcus sp. CA031C]RKI17298.1 hypothetical protein D7Y13_00875 [Corallococcus praedator]